MISGIVNGRWVPSVRSYERLGRRLGLLPACRRLVKMVERALAELERAGTPAATHRLRRELKGQSRGNG